MSFAVMMLGVWYTQAAPGAASPFAPILMLGGLAGVAVAGFWRARLVATLAKPRAQVSDTKVHVARPALDGSQRSERLRDFGVISLLLGLFLLLVAFFVLFVSRPAPNIAIAGVILTTLGALALAQRYRFFAVLVACFVVPVGIVEALVAWPPVFLVLLVVAFAWLFARIRSRAHLSGS
ncbi:MAG TPA: hypothetical protein VI056_09020 [Candidatus Limnocylindria bacterium]